MSLEQRNDVDLFDRLAQFLPGDSPALDPSIDYEAALGFSQMRSAAKVLRESNVQWDDGHWDDFVTRINGVFELMVRVIYAKADGRLAIDETRRNKMLRGEYANLISCSEFKQAFPELQAVCQHVIVLRRDSPVAHAGNSDGSEKPGLDEEDATLVRNLFAKGWALMIEIVRSTPTPAVQATASA